MRLCTNIELFVAVSPPAQHITRVSITHYKRTVTVYKFGIRKIVHKGIELT